MSKIIIEVTDEIGAGAEKVYGIIADYRVGHPRILPLKYFKEMTVKAGGYGAGTAIALHMEVLGSGRRFNMVVSEPQPGLVLVEEDAAAEVKTSFILEPLAEERTRVTIRSEFPGSKGMRGFFEKQFAAPALRRVFREELALLQGIFQD